MFLTNLFKLGMPGAKGDFGAIGIVGMPGTKGDRGFTGVEGPKGYQGLHHFNFEIH